MNKELKLVSDSVTLCRSLPTSMPAVCPLPILVTEKKSMFISLFMPMGCMTFLCELFLLCLLHIGWDQIPSWILKEMHCQNNGCVLNDKTSTMCYSHNNLKEIWFSMCLQNNFFMFYNLYVIPTLLWTQQLAHVIKFEVCQDQFKYKWIKTPLFNYFLLVR